MLAALCFSACKTRKAKERAEQPILSLAMVTPIFGEARGVQSGIADLLQTDEEIEVTYHFYTAMAGDVDKEIGLNLAPKIREFYGKFGEVDRVKFGIYVPSTEEETGWELYVSFVLTRKLVNETEWSKLLDEDLLKIALEVRRFD
jgi:hypothetical protein